MTREEATTLAEKHREGSGSGWPKAQDIGGSWSLAWSKTDVTQGEVLRRRHLGLPDYPVLVSSINAWMIEDK